MIPVNTPLLDGNERKYLLECIDSGWISSEGPFVKKFEDAFAQTVGRKYAIACANGSGALDIAVAAAGIGPGDEVILPTFTIISPAASIVRAGGIPVVVDCDAKTWNMDVGQIESKITDRTKAILVVHIYGLPTDMDPILEIARRHQLVVIEDAAEMHGQMYKNRPCGSFGLISTFSFYPNKHVTCGEGGMVLTDEPSVADHCSRLRNLCFQPERRFVHEELGWNYRMTNMQAAIGLAQLEKLDKHVLRKREIGRQYNEGFSGMAGFDFPLPKTDYAENIYWVYGLVCHESYDSTSIVKKLADAGIGTRPFFWPIHEQPVFKNQKWFEGQSFPHAQRITRNGFYLPSGLGLSDNDIQTVVETLRKIVEDVR
jgi:perosamine synthetase